jgi:hypothetical protein
MMTDEVSYQAVVYQLNEQPPETMALAILEVISYRLIGTYCAFCMYYCFFLVQLCTICVALSYVVLEWLSSRDN